MADIIITPTPPTELQSPYVDIQLKDLPGDTVVYIPGGLYLSVPQIWSLNALYIRTVADATVANRNQKCYIMPNRNISNLIPPVFAVSGSTIVASETKTLLVGDYQFVTSAGVDTDFDIGIGDGHLINTDDFLRLFLSGGQAGDLWQFFLRIRYLNPVLGLPTPYNAYRPGG